MYIIHVQSISLYNHINLPRTCLSVHVESFLICSISCTSFSSVVDMVWLGASFSLQNSNKANIVKSAKIIHFAGVFLTELIKSLHPVMLKCGKPA